MGEIVLARIDDRLIHGQVMTAWLQFTGGNHIVIVDDATAGDEFTKSIMFHKQLKDCYKKMVKEVEK